MGSIGKRWSSIVHVLYTSEPFLASGIFKALLFVVPKWTHAILKFFYIIFAYDGAALENDGAASFMFYIPVSLFWLLPNFPSSPICGSLLNARNFEIFLHYFRI